MNTILIILIVVLVVMAVVSLVRGIAAFLQSTRDDLDHSTGDGPSPMQLKQNQMMYKRILYQGAAVLVVALLLAMGSK